MVSFQPTDEQQMIVDTVRAWAMEQVRPLAHEANETGMLPEGLLRQGQELGLVAANIPEEYGGFGERYSPITGALVAEQLAYGDLSTALHLMAPAGVAVPLLVAGTEAQKERWLPRFAEEGFYAAAALVEPRWNYDPAALTTVAQRSGEGWLLSGQKSWVVLPDGGTLPPLLLVYALDEEQGSSQAFLVEGDAGGIVVEERERGMGLHALARYLVTFEEAALPAAARLGEAQGSEMALLMNHARVGSVALATGLARAAYEYAQGYAKEREAFGKPVAQFQSIAFMLAEMRIAVESMQLLGWEAAWQVEQGHSAAATRATVLAKQYADEYVLQVADRAVQILGGHGYIRDYPVERWLREARASVWMEGMTMG